MITQNKKEYLAQVMKMIQDKANELIDSGINKHPMDLLVELTITAYEADLLLDILKGTQVDMSKVEGNNVTAKLDNVVPLKPKKEEMN
jgi:hypothetical protein